MARALDVGKVPFARALSDLLSEPRPLDGEPGLTPDERNVVFGNFAVLFEALAQRVDSASTEETAEKVEQAIKRTVERLKRDHHTSARKRDATHFLHEVESHIHGASDADEGVRTTIRKLIADFDLDNEPLLNVPDFTTFRERLPRLQYGARQRWESH